MLFLKRVRLIVLGLLELLWCATAGGQAPALGNPTLTTTLAAGTVALPGELIEFTVRSTHPRFDRVTLTLINPPPGCMFTQQSRISAPGLSRPNPGSGPVVTAIGRVRWLVPDNSGGLRQLTFRATDHTNPSQTLFTTVEVRIEGESRASTILIGDVTGDGILDTVASAILADVSGTINAGALYVWKGATTPSGVPDATLAIPGATTQDRLGDAWKGQGTQLADVTGDGVLDVVTGTTSATIGGTPFVGAVFIWSGGASMTGTPAPFGTLTTLGALVATQLGARWGQGIQLADVTGDGTRDVITGSISDSSNGISSSGALYVWKGGSALAGNPAPLASLSIASATASDALGMSVTQLVDVTGDGMIDIVAGSDYADVGGVQDAGAIYIWKGGPSLTGAPPPLATLTVAGAVAYSALGYVGDPYDFISSLIPGQVGRIADVTGDGIADLVVGAIGATAGGVAQAGAVYVWKGGAALSGTPAPRATLTVPGATFADQLGLLGDGTAISGQGIQLSDVTGDGVLDVVVGASKANIAGVVDAGAIYVWQGGAALAGSPAILATLTIPGATKFDRLADAQGQGLLIADMDSDGVRDIVAGARNANVAGVVDAGAIYAWKGGTGLTGTPAPMATLTVPGAQASDMLGTTVFLSFGAKSGHSIQLADVTGDGHLDVIANTMLADVLPGKIDGGAVYVWAGGPAFSGPLSPVATLYVQNGRASDLLGISSASSAQGVQLVDLTGDGVSDLVASAPYFDFGAATDAGAIFIWSGGAALVGTPLELARLRASNRVTRDLLGYDAGPSTQIADVTGDGVPDVVADTRVKDLNGLIDVGGVYVWKGGAPLNGTLNQFAELTDPNAIQLDALGSAYNQGYYLADVTGDGLLDVVAGSYVADVGGVVDTGALYIWQGGSSLVGAAPLLSKPYVPGAKQSDTMTNWN